MNNRSVLEWPTGVSVHQPDKCFPGFTLFHVEGTVYLIDMRGEICHLWGGASPDMKYLPGGRLLTGVGGRSAVSLTRHHTAAGCARSVAELNWEGDAAWTYELEPGTELHHDLARLPGGNTLLLLRNWVEAPAGWPDYQPPDNLWYVIPCAGRFAKPILNDFIREVAPDGRTVWEWHSADHVDEFLRDESMRAVIARHTGDWLHTNTAEPLPDGNVLVSFNRLSMVAIIDRRDGRFLWTWGRGENGTLSQHHPNMIPKGYPGEGNILIYDNGGRGAGGRFRPHTRLIEVNPQSNEIEWEYVNLPKNWLRTHHAMGPTMLHHMRRFFSPAWGSAQRLPNGNTLTLDSAAGRLFEITYDGEIVWEFVSPFIGSAVLPLVAGGIEEDAGLDPKWRLRMPGTAFYFRDDHPVQFAAGRMPTVCSFIYRCYRIPFDAAPRASHG